MAILQLSRITHRKGLGEDLPQLAGAELGWSIDEQKLFIGNGTIIDGAPVIGNTEILTEFSDIMSAAAAYTYKGAAGGYVVITGEGGEDIVRTLQSKFDDFVSVRDFGAVGDGTTDDTEAINRALFELFCRDPNVASRRSLFFPAGTYRVSGPIKIPPHAKLWGEGLASSVIKYISGATIDASLMVEGEQYAISDVGSVTVPQWQAAGSSSGTVDDIFTATATLPPAGGTVRLVSRQVVETADSLHQTGAQLGTNSATLPRGIEMSSIGIESGEENTLLRLDSVTDSGFSYLALAGAYDEADLSVLQNQTSAIEIASTVATTSNITLSKLVTSGTTYGLRAEGDTKGIVFENSGLDFHYKGVHVVNPTTTASEFNIGTDYVITSTGTTDFVAIGAADNNPGTTFTATGIGAGTGTAILTVSPTGVVVSRNIFGNIATSGVHFENVSFNSSGYNIFYNVGNDFGGNASPIEPVIILENDLGIIQSVSVGDLFEREHDSTVTRVELRGKGGIYLDGSNSIHLGSYEREVGLAADITVAANVALVNTVNDISNSYKVDYNIINAANNSTRLGVMTVSVSDTDVSYTDEYSDAGVAGLDVILAVVSTGTNDSTLEFTSTELATINFSVVRLD